MRTSRAAPVRRWAIWAAAAVGLFNALPSYYWAFGGSALLPSIGQWLIDMRDGRPWLTGSALLGVAVVKTLAAVLPLGLLAGARRGTPLRGGLVVLIAVGLTVYGTAGIVVNGLLLGWPGSEPEDPTARLGQAALWYPMLLLWGLLLGLGLRGGRRRPDDSSPSQA